MKAISWGPPVRSYVKGVSQSVGCMDSKANGTNFHHGVKKAVQLINEELVEWSRNHAPPGFGWTSLQLNANTVADWHVDYRNLGPSVILVVGEHSGGELEVEGLEPTKLDYEGVLVDGRVRHRSLPCRGERYSVVAFTHECHLKRNT